jgi:hypothetical protein
VYHHFSVRPVAHTAKTSASKSAVAADTTQYSGNPDLVGPRMNILADAPKEKGLERFAVPVPGVLSRSEQPTFAQFQYLKKMDGKAWLI